MFRLDPLSGIPIYEQLAEQVEKLIVAGVLKANDKLPSVRTLSVELSVNPNTISRAYNDLCAKGVIYSIAGKGCFVCENVDDIRRLSTEKLMDDLRGILRELRKAGIGKAEITDETNRIFEEEII